MEGFANLKTYLNLEFISKQQNENLELVMQQNLQLDCGSEAMLSGDESSIQMVP